MRQEEQESLSSLLREITMTGRSTSQPTNIYRQSTLPRRRLFESSASSRSRLRRSFLSIFICFLFGFLLLSVSFMIPFSSNITAETRTQQIPIETDKHQQQPATVKPMIRNHSNRNEPNGKSDTVSSIRNNNNNKNNNIPDKQPNVIIKEETQTRKPIKTTSTNNEETELKQCTFRTYKPNRLYKLDDEENQEDFLTNANYIRGVLPFVINPHSKISSSSTSSASLMPSKICLDTSEWENVKDGYYPFSDGQNPSIVSLSQNNYSNVDQNKEGNNSSTGRLDINYVAPLSQIYNKDHDYELNDLYLGLLLFGDSQCRWNLTAAELEDKKFSPLQSPPEKRSMVMILNEDMKVIDSTVLKLELDAKWGTTRKKLLPKTNGDGSYQRSIVELDDARLFFHNGQLHVLYRNGPYYGYDKQVQNPIHFESIGDKKFKAFIKSSETFTICCGRNIAFISERPEPSSYNKSNDNELLALTWIDPVTTEVVNIATSKSRRLVGEDVGIPSIDIIPNNDNSHRILRGIQKSHIHGTNGYMLPLHSSSELLGIAHFHRPEGRDQSHYARHGHHYTHAFFTIQLSSETNKYVLKRLSNEFIFMAPSSDDEQTGDVIQFASGLDLIGSDIDGKLLVSYGINDCEAATFFLGMEMVQDLLIDVEEGVEVVNLMRKLGT